VSLLRVRPRTGLSNPRDSVLDLFGRATRRRRLQVGPEIVGWAAALVSVQITEGDYTPLSQFDADAADPARFFDRLCDRIEVNRATCRDKERDRSVADGRAPAEDDEQSSLAGGWST